LQALEARRLIDRAVDEADRRRSTITITQSGIETLRNTARNRESWLARAVSASLSDTEREVLRIAIPLMERLADL
jgi:DNA-binding MarR family transcriptional regulator